jgi:oxygen-independent coproporphyrinogen-3 oxidase
MRSDLATCYGEERLPRYTSYPTAPHFSATVQADTYAKWLAVIPREAVASLYLHIPFCRAMCWYCGCNTSVTRRDEAIEAYATAMHREIELVRRQIPHPLRVGHIHFGGGTPTILAPDVFARMMASLRRSFRVSAESEVAIEIDPRTLNASMVEALADAGVNRASIGVQSFDPKVQRAINRVQSFNETAAASDALRRAGIAGMNFDLIYGLPHQTVASCIDTVLRCIELRPERFSVFGYAHVPSFKTHQQRIEEAALPNGSERYRQFEAIAAVLKDMGYQRVGLDHFCLPEDSMSRAQSGGKLRRNFQGYTTDAADVLLGFGASAIGRLAQGYVQNEAGTRAYGKKVSSHMLATVRGYALTDEDRLRGEIIERVMCDFGVDIGQICARYGREPSSVLGSSSRLKDLIDKGVATLDGARLRVVDDAHFLVRSVAAAFDAHLDRSSSLHSRAV